MHANNHTYMLKIILITHNRIIIKTQFALSVCVPMAGENFNFPFFQNEKPQLTTTKSWELLLSLKGIQEVLAEKKYIVIRLNQLNLRFSFVCVCECHGNFFYCKFYNIKKNIIL